MSNCHFKISFVNLCLFICISDNFSPPKLKHICRSNIRGILRRNIDREYPNLKNKQRRVEIKHRRQVRRIVIPIFDESDLSNHSQSNSEFEYDSDSPEFTISSRIPSRMSVLLEDFLRRHAELQALNEALEMQSQSSSSDSDFNEKNYLNSKNEKEEEGSHNNSDNQKKYLIKKKNRKEKEDSESKVNPDNKELTYSASFISMSDDSLESDDSVSPSLEEQKKPNPHSSKKQVRRRKTSSQPLKTYKQTNKRQTSRKRPASDDQGTSNSSQIRARVKRRAATVVWKRIIPRDSDSEMEEESKNTSIDKDKENNKDDEDDETYTKHMIKRIAGLPLPSSLIRYLNYKRNNL